MESVNCTTRLLLRHFTWPSGRADHPSVCPISTRRAVSDSFRWYWPATCTPRLLLPDPELVAGSSHLEQHRTKDPAQFKGDFQITLGIQAKHLTRKAGNVYRLLPGYLVGISLKPFGVGSELGSLLGSPLKSSGVPRPEGVHLIQGLCAIPGLVGMYIGSSAPDPMFKRGFAARSSDRDSERPQLLSPQLTRAQGGPFLHLSLRSSSAHVWEGLPCIWRLRPLHAFPQYPSHDLVREVPCCRDFTEERMEARSMEVLHAGSYR